MRTITTLMTTLGLIVSAAGGLALCEECDTFASPEAIAGGGVCACSEACSHSPDAPDNVSVGARSDHNGCRGGLSAPEAAVRPDPGTRKPSAPRSGSYIAPSSCETEDLQTIREGSRSMTRLPRGTPPPAFLSSTCLLL